MTAISMTGFIGRRPAEPRESPAEPIRRMAGM
jgi:hypothetical protein